MKSTTKMLLTLADRRRMDYPRGSEGRQAFAQAQRYARSKHGTKTIVGWIMEIRT